MRKILWGKWGKKFLDAPLYPDPNRQLKWGLVWAETHPPSKFHGNLFSCFCIILTNQPTNNNHINLQKTDCIWTLLLSHHSLSQHFIFTKLGRLHKMIAIMHLFTLTSLLFTYFLYYCSLMCLLFTVHSTSPYSECWKLYYKYYSKVRKTHLI